MQLIEAQDRLRSVNYQVLPIQGEALWMVFWPTDKDGNRRTQALDEERIITLAESIPLHEGEQQKRIDVRRVGIVGRLRKLPATTDGDGEPKVAIVIEVAGRGAVNSLPIEDLRDMLGQDVLVSINGVQIRFEIGTTAGG